MSSWRWQPAQPCSVKVSERLGPFSWSLSYIFLVKTKLVFWLCLENAPESPFNAPRAGARIPSRVIIVPSREALRCWRMQKGFRSWTLSVLSLLVFLYKSCLWWTGSRGVVGERTVIWQTRGTGFDFISLFRLHICSFSWLFLMAFASLFSF